MPFIYATKTVTTMTPVFPFHIKNQWIQVSKTITEIPPQCTFIRQAKFSFTFIVH